ncbi:MAG: acyl-ACP--UDP-N-acetylglucosamine O-acyltransferase [Candidatus Omnitrophica bacterium]|nr:acyl-ACP--UDP-N-acetylglucosamine O-acyltransferase [Candidatus Omnitrophota bacterium]
MRSGSEVRSRGQVEIHPTAIVHADAELGEGVKIGPFSIIEANVRIGDGTIVGARVTIEGYTTIGSDNEFYTGAVIGSRTQDKKFDGGISYLRIGNNNHIREYVTVNPGTKEGTETVIGSGNLLMAYSHVAHDCIVRDNAILANQATLAGHVIVEDKAIIGGLSAVHQFVRIGKLSLVGGCSKVVQDIPPFMMVDGHPAQGVNINSVGMDRSELSKDDKSHVKKAFKILFRSGLTLKSAIAKIENELPSTVCTQELITFLKKSERGICG